MRRRWLMFRDLDVKSGSALLGNGCRPLSMLLAPASSAFGAREQTTGQGHSPRQMRLSRQDLHGRAPWLRPAERGAISPRQDRSRFGSVLALAASLLKLCEHLI